MSKSPQPHFSLTAMSGATALLLGAACPAWPGSPQEQTLAQMDHAMWTARDGAPQNIRALAQAADGTLWIGADAGLFNFDGRTFTAVRAPKGEPQLPDAPVYSICITKDGAVWVGFLYGATTRLAHGHVTLFTAVEKTPIRLIDHLSQAADGSIWGVANQSKLVRFGTDLAWHIEPTPTDGRVFFFIDSSNVLWLVQGGRLYRRPLPESAYTATDVHADLALGFTEARDGSIWMFDVRTDVDVGRTQLYDRLGHLRATLPDSTEANALLNATDDSLVIATQNEGLTRFVAKDLATLNGSQSPVHPDTYTQIDGLSADKAYSLFLDGDGEIWVGSRRGLDRFRTAQLVRFIPANPRGNWQLCANNQGELWISSTSKQLYRLSGGTTTSFPNVGDPYWLDCSGGGDVTLTDHAGIWRVDSNHLIPIPQIPGARAYQVTRIASTSDHTLYASTSPVPGAAPGYWQYKNDKWTKVPGENDPGRALYVDSHDRVWIGYRDGRVSLLSEGRMLSSSQIGLGSVETILETSHGLFAGGRNGLAVVRDDRVDLLAFADDVSARRVGAIVESRNGDLWLNAARGIVRISAVEIDAALSRPAYPMKSDLLTEGDFVGASQEFGAAARAARDGDGNLWFVTLNGIVHIDPEHWRSESRLPVVSVKSIAADHRTLDETMLIAPGSQSLEIRYFGLNLTAPEKVVYRYRLDGFDDAWQDVGHRAEAIYTRLAPGRYTFRVMASNGNGVWTAPVSAASFVVLPSFYQTRWFYALSAIGCLALLGALYRVRVRQVAAQVRGRLEARLAERERIARDLHDTLLQGMQGLIWRFEAATNRIPPDQPARQLMEDSLERADKLLEEGRDRVKDLRPIGREVVDLPRSLAAEGEQFAQLHPATFRVSVQGTARVLHPIVREEGFLIAREALGNAFRHSGAKDIEAEITYDDAAVRVRIRDDGRGISATMLQAGGRPGHFGLMGMRERARKLGGQLEIWSKPDAGTEVELRVPASVAYRPPQAVSRRARFWLSLFRPSAEVS
jgi:signal transduction histidine kinase/ligand-binding sensor domain-containing protein